MNAVLLISYIGYHPEEIKAGSNMHIVLKEKNELLNEIVVVGYGTQKKVNLTGAVSVVNSKDVNNRSVVSVAFRL